MVTKNVFWQALVVSVVIFSLGLIFGFFIESYRAEIVRSDLVRSETAILDYQLRTRVTSVFNVSCEERKRDLFDFADSVYYDSIQLDDYSAAKKFTGSIDLLHRKYDLLRMMIWAESISLREECKDNFHTIVYLYNYGSDDINVKAMQSSISRLLVDFKEEYSYNVILIPIAANLDLDSVSLVSKHHNISSFPSIVIDEKIVIEGLTTSNELKKFVFQNNASSSWNVKNISS